MKRKSDLKARHIDSMVRAAAKCVGDMLKLFECACKAEYGELFDARRMRAAYNRYVQNNFLVDWVRKFVYKGLYREITVPA